MPPVVHHSHRNVQTNTPRAAVLGAGDGLLTNVSLVLGVAGANSSGTFVRLAGLAGLLAGAFSMAAGELVSVRAQDELVRREVEIERHELLNNPEDEQRELAAMYESQGLSSDDATTVAVILSKVPALALDTHARLELGVDPNQGGSALRAAGASFVSFAIGAFLPLIPWLFAHGVPAMIASVIIGGLASFILGAAIGRVTGQGQLRVGLRQLAAAAVAAAVTYGVGAAIGVQVH
jgi:VIT1/CCC1 family predicted Fe2+/Mn2+ transporter